jgi:hypothetical protein
MIYLKEESLHYVWRKGLFDFTSLKTTCGQFVQVVDIGTYNTNSGPDFKFSKVRIGDELHIGHVEIHLKSSDWLRHGHQYDDNYKNVILHVVQENDLLPSGLWLDNLPCLELKPYLKIEEYKVRKLMQENSRCGFHCLDVYTDSNLLFPKVFNNWKWDLLLERMERKADKFYSQLRYHKGDLNKWIYRVFASQLGYPLNEYPMDLLSKALPFEVFKSYRKNKLSMEALFLGQSGLLNSAPLDDYEHELFDRYFYMRHKHKLEAVDKRLWQYFRLRPFAFPDRRIAFLASFASHIPFSSTFILEQGCENFSEMIGNLNLSDAWKGRHRIGKHSNTNLGLNIGGGLKKQLEINMLVPLIIAYGRFVGNKKLSKSAYEFLSNLRAESNNICRSFSVFDVEFKTAVDTQAAVELKKNYCDQYRCLACQYGQQVLKNG